MRPYDQLAVMSIKLHCCNITRKHVLYDSHRFSSFRIPNLNRPLSCHVDFEVLITELCATDWVVIRELWNEWPLVLEYFE